MMRHLALSFALAFAAAGCDWQQPPSPAEQAYKIAIKRIESFGGKITRGDDVPGSPVTGVELCGPDVTDEALPGLTYLPLVSLNLSDSLITDDGLWNVGRIDSLEFLSLGNTAITDAGLKEIRELSNLKYLYLGKTGITDAGVKDLKKLAKLQHLDLSDTNVTDAALKDLKEHKDLQWLALSNTKITDAGLKELKDLPELRELFLVGTKTTDAGQEELKKALPKLKVTSRA